MRGDIWNGGKNTSSALKLTLLMTVKLVNKVHTVFFGKKYCIFHKEGRET
jgi:hypothetical protein